MGPCGGTAVEFSQELIMSNLFGATEPTLLSWLGEKVWIWSAVALGIGFVIFVHELGHFLAAKLFGVKVEKFYVGFDVPIRIFGIQLPRTFGKFRWGETEYGIGVIPLGGYVKMLGQDDDPRRAAEERERIRTANQAADVDADEPAEAYELDPRSYPAKTVWQRMIIISAGVVMNLLTSVLFAAIAFGMGVKYTPAVVGNTVAGYPAWEAGVEPGGRVVSAGRIDGDEKLHFMDMTGEIMLATLSNPGKPVEIAVRYDDGERGYQLLPRQSATNPDQKLIGIGMSQSANVGDIPIIFPNSVAADVLDDSIAGAQLVAVDGEKIAVDPVVGAPLAETYYRHLAARRDQPVVLKFELVDGSTRDVTLPPQAYKSFGFDFAVGPVAGLVKDGPAETAGIERGDRIVGFGAEKQPVDAYGLPGMVADTDGSIVLHVERGSGESLKQLELTIPKSGNLISHNPLAEGSGQIELQSLGLTYQPLPTVVSPTTGASATGQPAESLQAGDRIKRVAVKWPQNKRPEALAAQLEDGFLNPYNIEKLEEGWEIGPDATLVSLLYEMQRLPAGTQFKITAERGEGGKIVTSDATLTASNGYWYERGFDLPKVTLTHNSESVGEAFALGLRESKRKVSDVFGFLQMSFTGKLSRKNVGGPGVIAYMASTAASVGFSQLLLFLTLLSVNLAILNFLPIPALDGGHMVFLIAEAVRGKPVDEEIQARVTMAGVLLILALMFFVIINDAINLTGRG